MRQSDRPDAQARAAAGPPQRERASAPTSPERSAGLAPARALALQRTVGNRAAARILARWSRHPDEKEKGKLLSDDAAADYLHFNLPLNK